jgi:3-hydroxybutyryl-CoA dehydrogenase
MKKIAIIGAGLMGHGFALVFAAGGYDVAVTDPHAEQLAAVKNRIADTLVALDKEAALVDHVRVADSLEDAVADADLVIEAAPEKLELKQDLFERIEAACSAACILASNTSVIPITQVMAKVKRKERALGTHWFNPPYLVPLVEVIQTADTSPAVVARVMELLVGLGKVPVHVKKDVPGFVGNRLQHAMWREAIALIEDGVCDANTIDLVVTNSFGRRLAVLGPMANADMVGTDLTLDIQNYVLPHLDRSTEPTDYLKKLNTDGKLGFKTNSGFHEWTEDKKQALRSKVAEHLKMLNKILGNQGG